MAQAYLPCFNFLLHFQLHNFGGHSRGTDKGQIGFQVNQNKPITNHNNTTPINTNKAAEIQRLC